MGRKTTALGGHARCGGKLSCRECRTGITNMWTHLEVDNGVAKYDHFVVAGDAESQPSDDGTARQLLKIAGYTSGRQLGTRQSDINLLLGARHQD